jgi:hypothetical protein
VALTQVAWDNTNDRIKRLPLAVPDFRAGRETVSSSATTVNVTFSTALDNTSYAVVCTWQNTTDATPQFQPIVITALSTSGFTARWNVPTDSANYSLNWQVLVFA